MLFKQERYLAALTAANAAVGAALLQRVLTTHARSGTVLMVVLAVCSLYVIDRRQSFYRAGVQDQREIAAVIRTSRPQRWFGDLWLVNQVQFFAGPDAASLVVLQPSAREEDVVPGCLVIGGSRGRELVSLYVRASLPAFAQALWNEVRLPGWVEVLRIPRHRDAQRDSDLRIVCSPGSTHSSSR
jgi:hypothetical protein